MANQNIPTPHNLKIRLKARCPTSRASSCASAESIPLYIGSKPLRKDRGSSSPIANSAPRKNWRSEPNNQAQVGYSAYEDITWAVINNEISEWQNVCLTGRPSWWSPASKRTRGRNRRLGRGEVHAGPLWCKDSYNNYNSGKLYDEERRAVTDSYLADDKRVQDLAHLIAVQLLSACFTLPAECISSYKPLIYSSSDAANPYKIEDPRLISSLRMHTESRYSPSFGHQARNTSPTCCWQGVYDGTSRARSRGSSSGHNSPDLELSRMAFRKRKFSPFPHMPERSSDNCSGDGSTELDDLSNISPSVTMSPWQPLKHDVDHEQRIDLSAASEVNIETSTSYSNEIRAQSLRSSHLTTGILHQDIPYGPEAYRNSRMRELPAYGALHSIIHSEPHHVYIQLVKELVVKHWQTLRRQFGQGFGYIHHEVLSGGETSLPFSSALSIPLPAEVNPGSPALSSDGKERRRQARESGDFHSDSIESTLLFHARKFGSESGLNSSEDTDYMCQDSPDRNSLVVAEAISTAFAGSGLATAVSLCLTPPNTQMSSRIPSPLEAASESYASELDTPALFGTTTCSPKLSGPGTTPQRQRLNHRRHQKSNLSEICTPDEIDRDPVMSRFASPVSSQKDGSSLASTGEELTQSPKLETDETVPGIDRVLSAAVTAISCPVEEGNPSSRWTPEWKMRRPSMVRTSTSGTQVFTPGEDGVELDGLPTGPPSELWDSERHGKKRNQRSFL